MTIDENPRSATVEQAGPEGGTKLRAYTVDKVFAGAFPGGEPLLTEEAARRIVERPGEVRRAVRRRLRALKARTRKY